MFTFRPKSHGFIALSAHRADFANVHIIIYKGVKKMRFYDKEYYQQPCRVMYHTKRGVTQRLGGYALIQKMREAGRLVSAYSTSTGKKL